MGEVLLFRPRPGSIRDESSASRVESARILFFTGVRYERTRDFVAPQDGDDVTAPPAGKRGGRRRRRG